MLKWLEFFYQCPSNYLVDRTFVSPKQNRYNPHWPPAPRVTYSYMYDYLKILISYLSYLEISVKKNLTLVTRFLAILGHHVILMPCQINYTIIRTLTVESRCQAQGPCIPGLESNHDNCLS